jgi:hypothetical protein
MSHDVGRELVHEPTLHDRRQDHIGKGLGVAGDAVEDVLGDEGRSDRGRAIDRRVDAHPFEGIAVGERGDREIVSPAKPQGTVAQPGAGIVVTLQSEPIGHALAPKRQVRRIDHIVAGHKVDRLLGGLHVSSDATSVA